MALGAPQSSRPPLSWLTALIPGTPTPISSLSLLAVSQGRARLTWSQVHFPGVGVRRSATMVGSASQGKSPSAPQGPPRGTAVHTHKPGSQEAACGPRPQCPPLPPRPSQAGQCAQSRCLLTKKKAQERTICIGSVLSCETLPQQLFRKGLIRSHRSQCPWAVGCGWCFLRRGCGLGTWAPEHPSRHPRGPYQSLAASVEPELQHFAPVWNHSPLSAAKHLERQVAPGVAGGWMSRWASCCGRMGAAGNSVETTVEEQANLELLAPPCFSPAPSRAGAKQPSSHRGPWPPKSKRLGAAEAAKEGR